MTKQKCPSCGKAFVFEKYDWICPRCGGVVYREDTSYTPSAAKPESAPTAAAEPNSGTGTANASTSTQKSTSAVPPFPFPSSTSWRKPTETPQSEPKPEPESNAASGAEAAGEKAPEKPGTVTYAQWQAQMRKNAKPKSKRLFYIILVLVVLASAARLMRPTTSTTRGTSGSQTATTTVAVTTMPGKSVSASAVQNQTAACGENLELDPYTLQISGAAWADTLEEFPAEIQAPTGGRYLTVSYEYQNDIVTGQSPTEQLWCCLDTGEGFLLPLEAAALTEDAASLEALRQAGIDSPLGETGSRLVFLVKSDTPLESLSLRLYAGDYSGTGTISNRSATSCTVIALETEAANGAT